MVVGQRSSTTGGNERSTVIPTPPTLAIREILDGAPKPSQSSRDSAHTLIGSKFRQFFRRESEVSESKSDSLSTRREEIDRLVEEGTRCLTETARDLVIASWITELLTEVAGFAGLRDGLNLLSGLVAEHWKDCRPPLEVDGGDESRVGLFASLASDRFLLGKLRKVSLTETGTDVTLDFAAVLPGRASGFSSPLTAERISTSAIGHAISLTPLSFYENLSEDQHEAVEAVRVLTRLLGDRMRNAPDLSPITDALADCGHVLELILAVRRGSGRGSPVTSPAPSLPRSSAHESPPIALVPGVPEGSLGYEIIAMHEKIHALAEAAETLRKNRDQYNHLRAEMAALDLEFAEVSARIARDPQFARILETETLTGGTVPPPD